MGRKWTEEKVIEEIKNLAEEKGRVPKYDDDKGLSSAAEKYVGTWNEALKEAGFEPNQGSRKWSEEELEFLKGNYKQMTGEEIGKELNRTGKAIREKARRIGLEKMDQKPSGYWSEERIKQTIRENIEEYGNEATMSWFRENIGDGLLNAARKKFGSFAEAVEESGFDYREVFDRTPIGHWTEEKILEKLDSLAKEKGEESLKSTNLKKIDKGLYAAARKKYGSIKKAVEEIGFDYEEILGHKPYGYWDKEKVIKTIRNLADEHGKNFLNRANLKRNRYGLLRGAEKNFESFPKAVEEAGFDYEEIKRPDFGERVRWYAWEEWCKRSAKQIFDSERVLFKEKLGDTLLEPDLRIPANDLIVDAKVNAFDFEKISKDIDNYTDYCDWLEFWCLEGERDIVPEDVEIVSSEELLERLEENGLSEEELEEFEKKMEMIKRGINPYGKGQEELDEF